MRAVRAWFAVSMALLVGAYATSLSSSRTTAIAQEPSGVRLPRGARIAITIDDLPGSPASATGYGSERIVGELVAALTRHRVESATGFVIGERLDADPEGRAAVALWLGAGFQIGSHSYSHRSPEELGSEAYAADIVRFDARMRELERTTGQRARVFRFPYLAEGRTRDERALFSRTLDLLGYQNARVSLDFSDWAWGDPYVRCLSRGDAEALTLLSRSYVDFALSGLVWADTAARQVLRRPLVHVLLLHANVATAQNLDLLLSEYERAGARFVPLSEALADSVYTADYDDSSSHVLTALSHATQRPLPPYQVRPLDLLALACR